MNVKSVAVGQREQFTTVFTKKNRTSKKYISEWLTVWNSCILVQSAVEVKRERADVPDSPLLANPLSRNRHCKYTTFFNTTNFLKKNIFFGNILLHEKNAAQKLVYSCAAAQILKTSTPLHCRIPHQIMQ
jgi:hypothetical protein